jgi:tRNA pseudouridine55 synthase
MAGETPGPAGILCIDKPDGPTSHDVVAVLRRALGTRKVGHAGTLDPMATGLLVMLVGSATRLARFVEAGSKGYSARIVFGTATDTDDARGKVVAEAPVDEQLADRAYAAGAVAALVGEHQQIPPAYAAIKVEGRRSYELARRGEAPVLEARAVTVHRARLVRVEAGPPVTWDVDLEVSKGTYVRAIARDLGSAHATRAHLGALRRTRVGALSVDGALTWGELEAAAEARGGRADALTGRFADPVEALGLPVVGLSAAEAALVADGVRLPEPPDPLTDAAMPVGSSVALVAAGELLAVYLRGPEELKPEVVLAEPLALEPGGPGAGRAP